MESPCFQSVSRHSGGWREIPDKYRDRESTLSGNARDEGLPMTELPPLEAAVLPEGVRARFVDGVNGLRMHLLEAGFARRAGRSCCCCTASPS
jgi:hypothetical protein